MSSLSPFDSDAWLAALVESSTDVIVSKTVEGIVTSWNASAERTFGWSAAEMIGQSILKIIPSDRHDEEALILSRIRGGERIEHFETRRQRKDGTLVDISLTVSPIMDEEGRVMGVSKIARDITEERRARETQRMLMREVNHRSKNLLALVEAMVRQSARHVAPSVFAHTVSGRIAALSKTQDLIVGGDWQGVELHELVRIHSSSIPDDIFRHYRIGGPSLRVSPGAAQALGMALHELFDGSARRLREAEDGRVDVSWMGDRHAPSFHFIWSEALPPQEFNVDGFVVDVLRKITPVSLNGMGTFSTPSNGLQWSLSTTSDMIYGPQIIDPMGEAIP